MSPSGDAPTHSDVLILGAGVIGLSAALQLLKAGRSVTLIDRGRAASTTSWRNCGTITPSHAPPLNMPGMVRKALRWMLQGDAPLYIKPTLSLERLRWLWHFAQRCRASVVPEATRVRGELLKTSRQLLEEIVTSEGLECEFQAIGTMYVYRTEQAWREASWLPAALAPLDIPIQSLNGDQLRAMEPALNDSVIGGFFHPMDGQVRPEFYAAELARRVRELGGRIVEHNAVQGLELEGDEVRAAHTEQGRFSADEFLMALGAWSPTLGQQLDLEIPIQPGKGYSITFERPAICPRIPMVLKERSVCVTACGSGFRLGSTMEFAGYDESLNRRRLDALIRGAHEYLREPHGQVREHEWFGWRPMTWDELPIIGRSPRHRNLTIATGHGMLGVSMSAATGRLVQEVVCRQPTTLDIHPFRPERFKERGYR